MDEKKRDEDVNAPKVLPFVRPQPERRQPQKPGLTITVTQHWTPPTPPAK